MIKRMLLASLLTAGGTYMVAKPSPPQRTDGIGILFVSGFGPIDRDEKASQNLYRNAFGIAFKGDSGEFSGYLHTEALDGVKSFALWPLHLAARSCFGTDTWPRDLPVPQAWIEFDVANVAQATEFLEGHGYRMLVKNKEEPWGQTVTRFLSPEGLLVGITYTPWMRKS